jgi:hypothetical protein
MVGTLLAESFHYLEIGGTFPFELYPGISFTTEEKRGNVGQYSRIVLDTNRCVDLATFFGAVPTDLMRLSPRSPWVTLYR